MTRAPSALDRPLVDDVAYQTLEHLRALRHEVSHLSEQTQRLDQRLATIEAALAQSPREDT